MDSDGEAEVAPTSGPSRRGSAFDPAAPEFLPRCNVRGMGPEFAGKASPGAPSLIFGGGGDFLSKYSHVYRDREAGGDGAPGARPRRKGDAGGMGPTRSTTGAGAAAAAAAAAAPERIHVQLNTLLVHARTVEKILQVVDIHFDQFNAVNFITALHRLATVVLGVRKGSLRRDMRFKRLIHKLSDTLRNADAGALKPQDLSNVAWAFTKLGLLNAMLFGHLADHIMRTIGAFEPVNLSMTLWAFARSGFLDEKLFRVAAAEVQRQLPDFQPQQIANTTWAMAKSGFVDEELFKAAANLALEKLGEFQPMNYSMLLYSFALAKLPHRKLFEEVGRRCTVAALSSALSAPHVVTNLALAYSEAGVANQEVFDAVAHVASNTLHGFRTQQIATLAQAFAHAEVRHEKLFDSISQAVVSRLAEFKQQDLQELLAAYEGLALPTAAIARAVEAQHWQEEPGTSLSPRLAAAALVALLLGLLAAWLLRGASSGASVGVAP